MGLADAGRRQDKDVPAHFSKAAGGGGRTAAVREWTAHTAELCLYDKCF